MKKSLFLLILLAFPLLSKAEVPTGVLGFGDGKYYDQAQNLKYLCFQDNNCYDLNQKFAFSKQVAQATIVLPKALNLLDVPENQGFPRTLDNQPVSRDLDKISCVNRFENRVDTLYCTNNSDSTISINQVEFTSLPLQYPNNLDLLNATLSFATADESSISFKADETNTKLSNAGMMAKVVVTLPTTVYIQKDNSFNNTSTTTAIMKARNFATLVLVGINGQEIVYKVN